jgi:glycosidase
MRRKASRIALKVLLSFAAILMTVPSCKKEPPKELPEIKADESTLNFAGDGGTAQLAITSSGEWVGGCDAEWIVLDPSSGDGDANVSVTVSANSSEQGRQGEILLYIKDSEDISCTVAVRQSGAGQTPPGDEDNSSVVIPKSEFSLVSPWGVTGSIMSLDWKNDLEMLAEPEYGWIAAFDVVVGDGEEFKFRKDASWAVNLGRGSGQPSVGVRYTMADDGGNLTLPAGTYDLYIHPTYMLLYAEKAGDVFAHGDAVPSVGEGENVRIYLLNNSKWTKPFMYAYVGTGELQPYGAWPGTYAAGTKKFGDYTYTYWEASGFSGVGSVNLILNNNGTEQYPLPDKTEPLWSNLTILNTLYFAWDGSKVTVVEDPSNPGVSGTGIEPDEMKFGSSSWTIIGTLGGTNWDYDFPMDSEGYWEVARDLEISSGEQFKFRQNRKWENNLGSGPYSDTEANEVGVGQKINLSSGAGNMKLASSGKYDIYISIENRIAYILTAGSAWTHESEGKPDYYLGGTYSESLLPQEKTSGLTYQVNVFSFKDSDGDGYGDFNGITQSLDYFDKLGVTALWLSPIQPAQSYHGYDVTDYETVNRRFGTEADFKNLIQTAHSHNIRIYMDYVINHAGDQNEWFLDIKEKGTASPYWDYFSLSKDPAADIAAGKIAQVPSSYGYNKYKWFPVTVGGKEKKRYKVDLDWTNSSAPTMTVTETSGPVTTTGTYNNEARYLYWGDAICKQFVDNGQNKYTLTVDYQSSWGCLVRTNNKDVWTGRTKWGFNKTGDQMQLGVPHILYSDDNPDNVLSIIMPGGEVYYYYSEFGTGMFVDFNFGPAESCRNSAAYKAIMRGVEKWLAMGVDGFRLDAVKHIYANETGSENKTFLSTFYDDANAIYKANASARSDIAGKADENIFMVGEVLSGDGDCTPFYICLPALFEFQFWWDLRECLNNETIHRAGYGQTFPSSLPYRWNGHRSVRSDAISTPKLANHDEDRTASSLGNYRPKIRLAAAVLLTSPGRPYIYQGEELGYWGTKSGGDEYVRTPILWTSSTSSAASKGVSNKVDWDMLKPSISVEAQSGEETSLLSLYRHFAYARNINPALADGWPEADTRGDNDGKIAAWYLHQNGGEKVVLVMHNFSSSEQSIQRWPGENVTNESMLVCNGRVSVSGNVSEGATVTLPAYSSAVFALN